MAKGEERRRDEDAGRLKNWKHWGPYLSERQWATDRLDRPGRLPAGGLRPQTWRSRGNRQRRWG
jgi:hypothetical protein